MWNWYKTAMQTFEACGLPPNTYTHVRVHTHTHMLTCVINWFSAMITKRCIDKRMILGKLYTRMQNNKSESLSYILHKQQLRMDERFKCKPESAKPQKENVGKSFVTFNMATFLFFFFFLFGYDTKPTNIQRIKQPKRSPEHWDFHGMEDTHNVC